MSALDVIHRRSNLAAGFVAPRSGDVTVAVAGLERMRRLVEALGNPQRAYETIHVAGSKGKGSTVAYAAAILTATGRRTGRYTSPHLMDWRERIVVDGDDISIQDFDRVVSYVDSTMARLESEYTGETPHNAFELLTAAAFVHFAEVGCDAAVIEVGIGGRFDSTNVIDADVAVITSIEAEHLDILGPTLADVAWNKAGIMRAAKPCVTVNQDDVVATVLRAEASKVGAHLMDLQLDGNEGLALAAVGLLIDRQVDPDTVSTVLPTAGRLPGRFEVFEGEPTIVLDVGHTPGAMSYLGGKVAAGFPASAAVVVLGLLADKDVPRVTAGVAAWAGQVIATIAPSPRAVPSSDLAAALDGGRVPVVDVSDPDVALSTDRDLAGPDGVVVVTGSFALVAHVRGFLIEQP